MNFTPTRRLNFSFHLLVILLASITPDSNSHLAKTERKVLFRLQRILEYPEVLRAWRNRSELCSLPPTVSLSVVCSSKRVTQLTVVGTNPTNLSDKFSIDSLFSNISQLSNLTTLSLVSLGIKGAISQINGLSSLRILNLSSNQIHGTVPDLKGLISLEELDLGGNQFSGTISPILKGTNLTTIILRNNSFRSKLPLEFVKFDHLQKLDVSSNRLFGPIPPSLLTLPSIHYINLARNQFSGEFPATTCSSHELKFLDVSENMMVGALPACVESDLGNRRIIYSWNCLSTGESIDQHPISFCSDAALAVDPRSVIEKRSSRGIKSGIVFAIIGGCLGFVGILGFLILIFFRRGKKGEENKSHIARVNTFTEQTMDARRMPVVRLESDLGFPPYHVLTSEEIEDVTNSFVESKLTSGRIDEQLFKGSLRNGTPVLVKRVELPNHKNPSQVASQYIEVLSKLRHPNLMSVLGHGIEEYPSSCAVFIAFECISHESLKDRLQDCRKREMLKWPQRLGIAMGIARGLQFLHAGIIPGSFGNNLKIDNIHLDENLSPKIANYHIPSTSKAGSESPSGRGLESSHKSDIYELGKIIIELITGKLSSQDDLSELLHQIQGGSSGGMSMVLQGAADRCIHGSYARQSLLTIAEIAINCMSKDASKRPSMEDVMWNLHYSNQVQEGWGRSGHFQIPDHQEQC